MDHNAEEDSESAKNGETDDLARVRIPASIPNKALLHVAGVNPFGVAVANAYNLAEIDFVDSIEQSGFAINNPNAVSSCGCGHSFQVEEGDADAAVGGCGSGCSA